MPENGNKVAVAARFRPATMKEIERLAKRLGMKTSELLREVADAWVDGMFWCPICRTRHAIPQHLPRR